jgi:isoquinoline 1-oxidoreductase subunit beta
MNAFSQLPPSNAAVASRRAVLKSGLLGAASLVVEICLPNGLTPAHAQTPPAAVPNAWLSIGPDGRIALASFSMEMGQGVHTAHAMVVAEELNVPLVQVRVSTAGAGGAWKNPILGLQITGVSASVRGASYTALATAAATARQALVEAAAAQWQTDAVALRAADGKVWHRDGRSLSYAQLAAAASQRPLPAAPPLKQGAWTVVGTEARRLDVPAKVDGSAVYGIDVRLPGMARAVIAMAPTLGATVESFDAGDSLATPGVRRVAQIDDGVAVVADSFWAALQGRMRLKVRWSAATAAAAGAGFTTQAEAVAMRGALDNAGIVVHSASDITGLLASTPRSASAEYESPYLAHATLEPMNFTAHVRADGCDIYGGTQFQQRAHEVAMEVTGLAAEQVRVHTTYAGGGFGRRLEIDFIRQAVQISKAAQQPVQLIWTRHDDTAHDYYRPATAHRLNAAVAPNGDPVWIDSKVVSASVSRHLLPSVVSKGVDPFSVEAAELPYRMRAQRVSLIEVQTPMPLGYWRSVSHAPNTFANECFVDELAAAARVDPVRYRERLLDAQPRLLAVLRSAADKAGWGRPAKGRYRGVAVMPGYGSAVAQVVEISVQGRAIRLHRVTCSIDCGLAVHPSSIRTQMEGSIVMGLTAALFGEITVKDGAVQQQTFAEYPMLLLSQTPRIDVHIVASDAPPGGVGEPGLPPLAPALVNALFAATGQRIRSLPLSRHGYRLA